MTEEKKQPEVEAIVKNPVKVRSSLGRKLKETFFTTDGQTVLEYVIFEILTPSLKDMVTGVIFGAVERSVYGESRGGYRPGPSVRPQPRAYSAYHRVSTPGPSVSHTPQPVRPETGHSAGDIIFATRVEAGMVLDRLVHMIQNQEYDGVVSVATLKSLVDLHSDWSDYKYGWSDLTGATVRRAGGGYILDLPPVRLIG